MEQLAFILVALVALEHVYILVLEMFLWTKPKAMKVFGLTQQEAVNTKMVAANLGLYNGFLAAGLIWGLSHPNPAIGAQVQTFFLLCVLVAAIYGCVTAKKSIIVVQGLPALIALLLVLL
jgi:putative membrane protein